MPGSWLALSPRERNLRPPARGRFKVPPAGGTYAGSSPNRRPSAALAVPGDEAKAALDVVLLSNVLHDWDVPECRTLIQRSAEALSPGGRLLIHDVFLNDELDGPLPIALYSAALFCLTEGRAYSAAEYRAWLTLAGLTPGPLTPTLIHCGVLTGTAPV